MPSRRSRLPEQSQAEVPEGTKPPAIAPPTAPISRITLKRFLMSVLIGFLCFAAIGCVALFCFQRQMIFFPREYWPTYLTAVEDAGGREIAFETSEGRQSCFYFPPARGEDEPPGQLWIFFGGNGSLALDWLGYVERTDHPETAILLVDYPGYGNNEGNPSRSSIVESAGAWIPVLSRETGIEQKELEKKITVVGHSMGAAAGLEFAVRHPVERVILLAPFTSLLDMAQRTVGWPLKYQLIDRFDNRARLDELATRPDPPRIVIYHGTSDHIVPYRMGEELGRRHPAITTFHSLEGCDHNWILELAQDEILAMMDETPAND